MQFKNSIFQRLFLNAAKLLSATGIATVLGLATAAMTARFLGAAGYGTLALAIAYVAVIGKLVSFQAWQAIVKHGSDALHKNDSDGLKKLFKFGFYLDAASAVVGTAIAIAGSRVLILLLGWDMSVQPVIFLYSWLILFSLSGTPTGVLRLFDRFDLLSYTGVFSAAIKLAGVGWCILAKKDLFGFVWVYLITGVVGQLYLIIVSLWVLHKHNLIGFISAPLYKLRLVFPGIWDYAWTTNLHATVRMLSRELDLIIIAGFVTPASVGIYKIAKQVAQILNMLIDPLYQSIYPEFARLWAKADRKNFIGMLKKSSLVVGIAVIVCWIVFLLTGRWIIDFMVGATYKDAYFVSLIYMLALVIGLANFAFTPALLAMGFPRKSFMANLISTVLYFIVLFPFVIKFGVAGASWAYVVYYVIWSGVIAYLFRGCFQKCLLTEGLEYPESGPTENFVK